VSHEQRELVVRTPHEQREPVSERRAYAPMFTVEHVEADHQELDESEHLAPAPPPHPQPSSPHSGR
jgi:hypothetical protein